MKTKKRKFKKAWEHRDPQLLNMHFRSRKGNFDNKKREQDKQACRGRMRDGE